MSIADIRLEWLWGQGGLLLAHDCSRPSSAQCSTAIVVADSTVFFVFGYYDDGKGTVKSAHLRRQAGPLAVSEADHAHKAHLLEVAKCVFLLAGFDAIAQSEAVFGWQVWVRHKVRP